MHQHSLRAELLESSFQKRPEGLSRQLIDQKPAVPLQQRKPTASHSVLVFAEVWGAVFPFKSGTSTYWKDHKDK